MQTRLVCLLEGYSHYQVETTQAKGCSVPDNLPMGIIFLIAKGAYQYQPTQRRFVPSLGGLIQPQLDFKLDRSKLRLFHDTLYGARRKV